MTAAETLSPETSQQLAGDRILGPDGLIAASLPGYEARQPQVQMANLVDSTLRQGGNAMVEAGCGTGKSLAYLIPAILSGQKVVVSTDTIQLQEQLVGKDLPFLARVLESELEKPLRFAIAKGRSNWFCKRNTLEFLEEETLFASLGESLGRPAAADALRVFNAGEWDGDKATLKLSIPDTQWGNIAGDDSCSGRQCPHANECPYLANKKKVEDADVVVTNATMYLLHHYIREKIGSGGILPEHLIWIADEAHTLSDKAGDVFGQEISQFRPVSLVKRMKRQVRALGLEMEDPDLEKLGRLAEAFFLCFHGAVKEAQLISDFPPEVIEEATTNLEPLTNELGNVRFALSRAARGLDPVEDKEKLWAVKSLDQSYRDLISGLEASITGDDPDRVQFVEITKDNRTGRKIATLNDKPIETAPIFRRILDTLDSAVFCSATLASGTGNAAFLPCARDLGLDLAETATMQVESPFDYAKQVIGYIPNTVPDTRHPEYHTACAKEIMNVLNYTQGRAFVLFTSIRDMRAVYDLVRSRVRFPLMIQGEKPKDLLIEEFRSTDNSVLFGVKTFWTGVDIPGDALSCVILSKLPFPNVSDPLTEAKCRKIKERGGNDFMEYSLPRCIQDVKQGFGRLIRSKTDEGIFVMLDSRLHTARYARIILNSLPNVPTVSKL